MDLRQTAVLYSALSSVTSSCIERILIFTFILIKQWPAIGFLIAAKSVFRFGELKEGKERKKTEYILIGTLLSFTFAIIVGILIYSVLLNYNI